jgi:hypothetical protein
MAFITNKIYLGKSAWMFFLKIWFALNLTFYSFEKAVIDLLTIPFTRSNLLIFSFDALEDLANNIFQKDLSTNPPPSS